jgi:hypothetical protein
LRQQRPQQPTATEWCARRHRREADARTAHPRQQHGLELIVAADAPRARLHRVRNAASNAA